MKRLLVIIEVLVTKLITVTAVIVLLRVAYVNELYLTL
jgi:hypothetical protein